MQARPVPARERAQPRRSGRRLGSATKRAVEVLKGRQWDQRKSEGKGRRTIRAKERSHSGAVSAFGGRRTRSGGPGAGE